MALTRGRRRRTVVVRPRATIAGAMTLSALPCPVCGTPLDYASNGVSRCGHVRGGIVASMTETRDTSRRGRYAPRPAHGLPDGLVLYDGVCLLCSGWVRFLIERDPEARFRFLSVQSDEGRILNAALGIAPDDPETNVIVLGGLVLFKSDAALTALSALPGWRWARWLRVAPRTIRDWLYDRIARNRYAVFGRTETCMAPGPELAKRMAENVVSGLDLTQFNRH